MKSREEIFNIYITGFNGYKQVKLLENPSYVATEEDIKESIIKTYDLFGNDVEELLLQDDEMDIVINKIKSLFAIFQEEGCAILGDYDHDYDWYNEWIRDNSEEYYWSRYKNYLINNKHFPSTVIDVLENNTLKNIMSYIGNPNDDETEFSIKGLVVGDVQSGKTSNYLGLITKAADAGYKVIFVLTGTIESLRSQTQARIEEGFIGFDVVAGADVGVGRGDRIPLSLTSRVKDFTGSDDQTTATKIDKFSSTPMVFVLKKNVPVLRKLYSALNRINTQYQNQKINSPVLIIDDEADNASINTNRLDGDNDPTKINGYIRKILNLFTRSSYVGFTATPFANVFISYDDQDEMLKDDLFPRDFIYALYPPSNYCGTERYFYNDNENVRYITDFDENLFPMKHKKEWDGNRLFDSTYHAINTFLLSNAIRDIRDTNKHTHRSMLINMSRFTKVQFAICDIVEDYFKNVKKAVKQSSKLELEYALTNKYVQSLKNSFDKEYSNIIFNGEKIEWKEVFDVLYEAIENIEIVVVNSSRNSKKLNYEEHKKEGLRVIAIGGLALSRGLTLEGLCVSYFYRNTSTFDVLMQMGRWFGYREDYADICKIFLTQTSADFYKEISQSIDCLKNDIRVMCNQGKKPTDFGIRVLNDSIEMGITAANKMRGTVKRTVRKSFYGSVFETPYLDNDLAKLKHNIDSTIDFLNSFTYEKIDKENAIHPYYNGVSKDEIITLLETLYIADANENFDVVQILNFLNRKNSIKKFDVLIMGGKSKIHFKNKKLNIDVPIVSRKFDFKDNLIRISRQRTRLGGTSDTKQGLSTENAKQVENDCHQHLREQDYMIEGRNPLFIIYFVDPNNDSVSLEERHSSKDNVEDEVAFENQFKKNMIDNDCHYLIGYAIAFPKNPYEESEINTYTVNKTVNYFDKEHDEVIGDDENE